MNKDNKFEVKFEKCRQFLKDNNFVVDDTKLKAVLVAIELGYGVLAVGPTGCGKTDFFMKLAKFLGGTYEYASLNGSVTIHDLTQERVLGKKGEFLEKDMILARWLRNSQNGISILQLDEINAAKPETLIALHPILDIKGELKLPYTNEILKVNKNAIVVMSCNEGDEYQGINAMNAAFQNRYVKVHFNYIVGKELTEMLVKKTGIEKAMVEKVVNCWEKYMASKPEEKPVISIRVLERWLEMSKFMGLRQAGLYTFGTLVAETEEELVEIEHGDFWVNLPN